MNKIIQGNEILLSNLTLLILLTMSLEATKLNTMFCFGLVLAFRVNIWVEEMAGYLTHKHEDRSSGPT